MKFWGHEAEAKSRPTNGRRLPASRTAAGDAGRERENYFAIIRMIAGKKCALFSIPASVGGGCRGFFSLRDKCVEKLFCAEKNP